MRYVKKPMPTMREIQALPPGKRLYLGHGLVLKVTPTGRYWMFRYTKPTTHRPTETSIGPWPECGYSSARQVAAQLQVMVLKGDDPVQVARQQGASKKTFAEACEEWINKHKSKWRSLRHVNVLIGKHGRPLADVPVRAIDRPMVVNAISDLYKSYPNEALRALRMWAQVLDFAKTMGYRDGDNPAAWRGNLEHVFPDRLKNHDKHYPSLPFKYVPEFMTRLRLRQVKGHSAAALEFQILTASRPGEVRNMKWSELDLINRIWTLPPERTKQNRQHRVPFPVRCMEILALQNEYRTNDFVFKGYNGVALDDKSVRALLKRMGLPKHTVPHGFRASFRNWAAHTFPRDRDLAELCLGHSVKGPTEGAYWTDDMLEQRRRIMDAWAEYCGSAV